MGGAGLVIVEVAGPHLLKLRGVDVCQVGAGDREAVVGVEGEAGIGQVRAPRPDHYAINDDEFVVLDVAAAIDDERDAGSGEGLIPRIVAGRGGVIVPDDAHGHAALVRGDEGLDDALPVEAIDGGV